MTKLVNRCAKCEANSVLSPIIIGASASAAKPARKTFLQKQRKTCAHKKVVRLLCSLDVIMARSHSITSSARAINVALDRPA